MKIILGIVFLLILLKFLFGHKHVKGYTATGLPIYEVGEHHVASRFDYESHRMKEFWNCCECKKEIVTFYDWR